MKTNNIFVLMALICLMLWVNPEKVLAQDFNDSTANFFTLTDYYDQFYDSLIQLRGIENMQGTGYNDYLRWKWFYSTRHGVDGEFGAMWETITEYYNNYQFPQNYTDESDWQFIGPLGIPLGHGHSSSENTGKGMMISIWVDDYDHSLIYAGSHHGGLWKTTDGGENWYPLHDNDERIHGVNSIAVDPDDNNIIYITCNSSLSSSTVGNFSEYSAGLFRSVNGGGSWNKLDPGINYPASNKSASARKIIVDPNSPDILFFLSYRLITRSNDQGANWDTVFFKNYDPWNNQGYIQNHSGLWDFEIAPWDTSIAYSV